MLTARPLASPLLGADAADDLVHRIESMESNRGDIRELRHEMELGFPRVEARFQQMDGRFEQMQTRWVGRFDAGQARMEALLQRGLREQTCFFFLAWSVLLAAIVG